MADDKPTTQPTDKAPEKKGGYGYGKKPWWYWVLIYVVVAIVVYGAVYFLYLRKSYNSGSNSTTNSSPYKF